MDSTTDKVIIISSDSHATVPEALWPEYLEPEFHEHLPRLREERKVYFESVWPLSRVTLDAFPDIVEDHSVGGVRGVHDVDVRLEQMDREGITAELVYLGDFRTTDIAHNVTNGSYPFEMWDAGARAFDRWLHDAFGTAQDRLLLTGANLSCTDMDAARAELRWIAARGFVGMYAPGFMHHRDMPPLFDPYWDPLWADAASLGIAQVVHAGYGAEQGETYDEMERVYREVTDAGGSEMDLIMRMGTEVFTADFFSDPKPRRALWQMMLGGVFDRHPDLKLMVTECRLDWIPAVLAHLDAIYDERRADLPAQRRPSEYWQSNCLAGASFVHKVEVEMRHEIGVETMLFGRDYPHPEGTWPRTGAWLRDAFAGVPERELRLILGENAIRFLGLDHDMLAKIADRVGPTVDDLVGRGPAVPEELVSFFDTKSGYLKPAEGGTRLGDVEGMLRDDLARATAGS
jgi:predicted TIM-barrel fold metal-dependent hydrolase